MPMKHDPVAKALDEIRRLAEIPPVKKAEPKPPAYVDVERVKTCVRCNETKSISLFFKSSLKADGIDYYCKECRSNNSIKSHTQNSVKCTLDDCGRPHWGNGFCRLHYERMKRTGTPYRKTKMRDPYDTAKLQIILNRYNADAEWYAWAEQQGCKICGDKETSLHIDHDHACCKYGNSCGRCIRGLVCASCNSNLRHYDNGTIRRGNPMIPKLEEYINEYQSRR